MSQSRQIKRLADYQAPAFLTHSIELEFVLDPAATQVTAVSKISRQGAHQLPLQLDGHGFELVGIWLNNVPLTDYQQTDEQLILPQLPDEFELRIVTQLNPAENTALEGLYLSAPIAPSVKPKAFAASLIIRTGRMYWRCLPRTLLLTLKVIRTCCPTVI
jgi:aminopeptidase N